MVNHYYFYCVDEDFGPFFLKFCSYFPYNAKLCINGHEYAKRQLAKGGIAFEALDNGILSCADPQALQRICDGLDDKKIDRLLRKWLARLPHPFDRARPRRRLPLRRVDPAGRVLADPGARPAGDRPHLLRAGHPREPGHRPPRPGATDLRSPGDPAHPGPIPHPGADRRASRLRCMWTTSVHASSSTTRKGRPCGPRPPSTTRATSASGRLLQNLPELRRIGFAANRRLLEIEQISHDCALGEDAFQHLQRPRESMASGAAHCASATPTCRRCSTRC